MSQPMLSNLDLVVLINLCSGIMWVLLALIITKVSISKYQKEAQKNDRRENT
jgi:hypothetical protein